LLFLFGRIIHVERTLRARSTGAADCHPLSVGAQRRPTADEADHRLGKRACLLACSLSAAPFDRKMEMAPQLEGSKCDKY